MRSEEKHIGDSNALLKKEEYLKQADRNLSAFLLLILAVPVSSESLAFRDVMGIQLEVHKDIPPWKEM